MYLWRVKRWRLRFQEVWFIVFLLCCSAVASAEVPTIISDAPPLSRNQNLILNGSFEEPHLEDGNDFDGFLPDIDGDGCYFLSPITTKTPMAQPDWLTVSGGGAESY